ncbi:hypothetical protein [Sulfobacillus thermotolerans]|uniref:hypothetical protein n=1 Tax=Sulfobacillus thermotolerans TaxID=338644 RepID=UPI0033687D4A
MRKWEYVLCAGVGGVSMVGCGWGGTTPSPATPPPGISSPPVGASAQKVRTTNVPPTILPAQAAAWRALVRTAHRDGMPMPPAYLQLSPSPALRHSGMWAIANDAAQNAEGVPVLWWGFRQPHKAWVWVPLPIDGDPQNPGYGPANTMMYWTDAVEYGGQTLWPRRQI